MPRASTRNAASQSQHSSQPRSKKTAQAARGKTRAQVEEDEEGEEEEEEQEDEDMEDADSDNGDDTVERKANDLVRLALFAEYRRTALKRDEIAKKVLGGRATKNDFQPVFERAQHILHKTFGMQLHEIMSRAERDRADAVREGVTGQEGESNVAGLKKKTTNATSKQYILRSTLNPAVIEAASLWDEKIEEAERTQNAALYPNDPERRPDGTLLGWRHAGGEDQLGATGVLHVILALILVNGRVLTDMQLRTYLKRLRLPLGSAMPTNASSNNVKPLTIDAYLTQLLKQSYLDKQKTALASGQAGGQKRVRGAATGGDDGNSSFEWKWGTRAIAEIGEEGVGSFVADFMDTIERQREDRRADEEGARGSGRKERERLEKRKEKLVTAIGRAAGGGLVPFK